MFQSCFGTRYIAVYTLRLEMNPSPSSYAESNYVQRRDAESLLAKYSEIIQWRFDGHESLLDIGCGSGDVTNDVILPRMPKEFGKLVGVDKLKEMVNYAKRKYERDNVSFHVLDIESEESVVKLFLLDHPEKFDHVNSFYALHWIPDQPRGMKNIYNLLKAGGDCLLMILAHHPVYDIYKELAKTPEWNKFMPSINDCFAKFLSEDHPEDYLNDVLRQTGFSSCNVEIVNKEFTYTGLETIKAHMTVVNPIWEKLTLQERDDYWRDYLDTAAQMNVYCDAENDEQCKFIVPYKLAIVYATK